MLSRRTLIASAALTPLFGPAWAGDNPEGLLRHVEGRAGGRLGVAALDTQTGRRIAWRGNERFAMCSTFKLLAASAVLHKVDRGADYLDRRVEFGPVSMVAYSPVTSTYLERGYMPLTEILAAAIEYSDNTAANLLLASLGGPSGVTDYARSLGDAVTRLDRTETALNSAIPGDPRDTTTPNAMLANLRRVTLENALSEASRSRLVTWLIDCKTAYTRIPAGLPRGWKSGNKTGSGQNGATNNVAIIWPPRRKPILLAVYYVGSTAPQAARDAVVADVARIVSGVMV